MVERLLRRLGAASGIFFVVLSLLGSDVLGGTETEVGVLVELIGFAFFPFFLGSLWVCLRSAEDDGGWLSAIAFGTGLVALAVKLASGAPVLATRPNEGMNPEVARSLIAMNDASFLLTFLPLAVMLSATSIVTMRWGALPQWLGWMSVVAALGLFGALSAAIIAPSPPEWTFLPMLLYLLWIVATSIVLIRRAGEPRPVESARLSDNQARLPRQRARRR
jgi:hypothetical protein